MASGVGKEYISVPSKSSLSPQSAQSLSMIPLMRFMLLFAEIMNEISASNGSWLNTRMPVAPGRHTARRGSCAMMFSISL